MSISPVPSRPLPQKVVLVLSLPMPENVTNSAQRGWRGQHARKVKYWDRLDELQMAGLIEPPTLQPFTTATIRSVMHLGAAMDDDNAMARHKPALDWLRTRGYIADDRKKNLTWEGLPTQIIKRDGNYRIELTLTET